MERLSLYPRRKLPITRNGSDGIVYVFLKVISNRADGEIERFTVVAKILRIETLAG